MRCGLTVDNRQLSRATTDRINLPPASIALAAPMVSAVVEKEAPREADLMDAYMIGPRIGKVKHDNAALILADSRLTGFERLDRKTAIREGAVVAYTTQLSGRT